MSARSNEELSRRERQIMDIIYRRGQATVAEVLEDLEDPPSYSSVRTLLGVLETKGHLKHRKQGAKYAYRPTKSRNNAARTAVQRLVETFFDGSPEKAMVALLDASDLQLSESELEHLKQIIERHTGQTQ